MIDPWIAILIGLLGAAALNDIRDYQIPNFFPIAVVLIAIPYVVMGGTSWPFVASHIASGMIAFALGMAVYIFNIMGGGDVKLFAATAAWFPVLLLPPFVIYMSLAGGVLAMIVVGVRYRKLRMSSEAAEDANDDFKTAMAAKVPYGVAIFAGALAAVVYA